MPQHTTIPDLIAATRRLLDEHPGRVILGITGPPGTGKSTVAAAIVEGLGRGTGVVVPMDGFHLTRATIAGTPLMARRGAPDTFDAGAFAATVHRIRNDVAADVAVPAFDHLVGDPVAEAITVPAGMRFVIVEGNYLLHEGAGWRTARSCFDAVWYLDTPAEVRRIRLEARHRDFGRSAEDAARFVAESDESNAVVIASTASAADEVFVLTDDRSISDAAAGRDPRG